MKSKLPSSEDTSDATNKKRRTEESLPKMPRQVAPVVFDGLSRLGDKFFDRECLDLSVALLGKLLCRRADGTVRVGRIVEVEAYTGTKDRASHSFSGKVTPRVVAMFMPAGTAYVYNIYGMYCCFNISSQEPGAAVLIRALEPVDGLDDMFAARKCTTKSKQNVKVATKQLTSGPSKLCQALSITKALFDQIDLTTNEHLWVQDDGGAASMCVMRSKRVGIDNAGQEAVNQLYRFYIKGNTFLSVKESPNDQEVV